MDLQDNQQGENREGASREVPNQNSVPSNSISNQQQNKSIHFPISNEAESPDPEPGNRLPVSNSEVIDNLPEVRLKSARSEPALAVREQKVKRRKVRAYVQDFTDYLPESLLIVNKTVIPPIVRTGERYQTDIPNSPPLKNLYRPMEEWLIWNGSTNPEQQPSEDQLLRFKELLGENRTEEQFINIRGRLCMSSWREVLEYISRSKGEMRRIFHMAQRNRI